MYDELIAELRMHHCDAKEDDTQEVCEECAYDVIIADKSVPSGIASVCVCGLMNRAADAIEELSKQKWIPVTERLPEKTGVYLAWMKWDLTEPEEEPSAYSIEYDAEEEAFGWWKSYYDAETLGWAGEDFIRYEGITHWMPLPEPPKEET